jgi:hypothetical protein
MSEVAKNDLSNVLDNTILTKLLNVDGDGSGLDADTVDGKHANELGRLDVVMDVGSTSPVWFLVAKIDKPGYQNGTKAIMKYYAGGDFGRIGQWTGTVTIDYYNNGSNLIRISNFYKSSIFDTYGGGYNSYTPPSFGYIVDSDYIYIYAKVGIWNRLRVYDFECNTTYEVYESPTPLTTEPSGIIYASDHDISMCDINSKNFSSSGYQKLPSGLIIQWGQTSFTNTGGVGSIYQISVTFPITFPNEVLHFQVSGGLDVTGGESREHNYAYLNLTTSGTNINCLRIYGSNSGSEVGYVSWIAIGY